MHMTIAEHRSLSLETAAKGHLTVSPRILISIPTGFQLRQFVHSGVLDLLLKQGCRVLVVSPNKPGEGFTDQLQRDRVDVSTLDVQKGRLLFRYLAARQYLYLKDGLTKTLQQKRLQLKGVYPGVALAAGLGNTLFRSFPPLRRAALRTEHFVLREKTVDRLLAKEPIDLILIGSPGFMLQDCLLLHAGVRMGIPVVAAVLSWDNLTSKGIINPKPDRLLVWSEHMKREAIEIHGIPGDRIVDTGAPLYDIFARAGQFGSRAENLARLGLDPNRRLIFYGTNHAGHFPDEVQVVKRVAQWVEEDALGEPCQLWVRLHPQAVAGPYKVPHEPYRRLASKHVKVEFPPVRDSNLLWDLPRDDIDHLVRLLRDADTVINSFSTLAIDAAVLDRPVVSVCFDPSGEKSYERSIRRHYDFTHMAHVVRSGAVGLATSADDLRRKIVRYLQEPALDREGRRRIVEQQFGRVDGKSALRVAEQVISVASRRRAASNGRND